DLGPRPPQLADKGEHMPCPLEQAPSLDVVAGKINGGGPKPGCGDKVAIGFIHHQKAAARAEKLLQLFYGLERNKQVSHMFGRHPYHYPLLWPYEVLRDLGRNSHCSFL